MAGAVAGAVAIVIAVVVIVLLYSSRSRSRRCGRRRRRSSSGALFCRCISPIFCYFSCVKHAFHCVLEPNPRIGGPCGNWRHHSFGNIFFRENCKTCLFDLLLVLGIFLLIGRQTMRLADRQTIRIRTTDRNTERQTGTLID